MSDVVAILPPCLDKKSHKGLGPPSIMHTVQASSLRIYAPAALIACPSFLSEEESRKWTDFIDSNDSEFEVIDQRATRGFAQRKHKRRLIISDVIAEAIFNRLSGLMPAEVDGLRPRACSSNIRLYKYEEGSSFGPHIDESSRDDTKKLVSKFTVLVYLADVPRIDGGRTIFYKDHKCKKELTAISPEKGLLLVHCHGDRCLTHEAELLRRGHKYVLRTDVLYGE